VKRRTTADLVLDAAAQIVSAGGVESLNISALHFESGISTGSIYHHFGSKDGVIARLIRRSYGDWNRDLGTVLRRHAHDPDAGIHAAISRRLAWGQACHGEARLVLTHRGSLLADPYAVEPRSVAHTFDGWLRAHADAERLPPVAAQIALPLVFGPAEDVLRAWLDAPEDPGPTVWTDTLASAASAALRAAGT
jgi:AcrR family transcriptional regulator